MSKIEAVKRIRDKMTQLKYLDSRFSVFGSSQHQYAFNPCLTDEEIAAFEARHKVKLPEEYRAFLLLAGNGGAGPAYGLFPLKTFEENHEFSDQYNISGFLSSDFPYQEELLFSDEEDDLDDHDYACQVQGSLPLAHMGCGMMVRLIVSGENRGELWVDDRCSDYGIYQLEKKGFLHWYEGWLDKEIKLLEQYTATRDFFFCEVLSVKGHGRARYGTFKNLRLSTFFNPVIWHFYYIDDREFLPTDGKLTAPRLPAKRSRIEVGLFTSDAIHPFAIEAVEGDNFYFINEEKDAFFEAIGIVKKAFTTGQQKQNYQIFLPSIETSIIVELTKETKTFQDGATVKFSGRLDLEFKD